MDKDDNPPNEAANSNLNQVKKWANSGIPLPDRDDPKGPHDSSKQYRGRGFRRVDQVGNKIKPKFEQIKEQRLPDRNDAPGPHDRRQFERLRDRTGDRNL